MLNFKQTRMCVPNYNPDPNTHNLNILFNIYISYFSCINLYNHVSYRLETWAVSHDVCFDDFSNEITLRRQALKTFLSTSHSYRYYLFFLVRGLIYV